jgi:threonine dehydrogenase-like Zn-dependent dehydrogenase
MAENTTRFLRQPDILPPGKLQFPIVVIGAGAIGSVAVVTLTKTGCSNITVWEPDTLEEHNAGNQPCRLDAIVIGGLIALLAKAHATGVVPAREILFDLPSLKLMTASAARQAALVA